MAKDNSMTSRFNFQPNKNIKGIGYQSFTIKKEFAKKIYNNYIPYEPTEWKDNNEGVLSIKEEVTFRVVDALSASVLVVHK